MKSAAYTQPLTAAMDEPPSPSARPYDAPALVKNRSTSSDSVSHHSWGYGLRRWLRHLCGQKDTSLKEAVEEAIEEHEEQSEAPLAPEERVMLHNVLDISDTTVNDIMVPRTDIAAVPYDISFPDLKAHILEQRHTRIPVYKDKLDQMQGFIHIKDLLSVLSGDASFDIRTQLHPLLFVPASMRVTDLLLKMRHAGTHIAIVVDEYGGTDGLVTMEDLIEEIVGDIQDEHDEDETQPRQLIKIGVQAHEADARIPIEVLEDELKVRLIPQGHPKEFDTLGGLIFFQLGRVPARGEVVPHALSGLKFEILDADPRRIHKVRILQH